MRDESVQHELHATRTTMKTANVRSLLKKEEHCRSRPAAECRKVANTVLHSSKCSNSSSRTSKRRGGFKERHTIDEFHIGYSSLAYGYWKSTVTVKSTGNPLNRLSCISVLQLKTQFCYAKF